MCKLQIQFTEWIQYYPLTCLGDQVFHCQILNYSALSLEDNIAVRALILGTNSLGSNPASTISLPAENNLTSSTHFLCP